MIIILICIWLALEVLVHHLEQREPPFEVIEPVKEEEEEEDLWNHRFIKAAGLTKPIEECEVEEVSVEDAPVCWRVLYSPSGRSAKSQIINLDDFNNKRKLLS